MKTSAPEMQCLRKSERDAERTLEQMKGSMGTKSARTPSECIDDALPPGQPDAAGT